ncbi:MAG: YeeE/YedE family protein [Actinomycetota bacterium]|nr:YeeE/YedE family protein [Actinomycetota bacterium]
MTFAILTGLFVGLAFGFVLQRGRFCMNSAFRDIITLKDFTLTKTVALALLVSMLGFGIMAATGAIDPNPKPILWAGNLVGSFIFGIGMVVAGGCASGVTYRVGEGMVGAMSAVVGLTLAAMATATGFLKPVKEWLQTAKTPAEAPNATIASILGLNYAVVAIVLAVVLGGVWWYFARKNATEGGYKANEGASLFDRIFKIGWGWLPTGVGIALVGMAAFPLSAEAGRNYPLGITSGWLKIGQMTQPSVPFDDSLKWDMWLIVGIVVGAAIAAFIAKELKLRVPPARMLVQAFVGGALMGFGAVCSTGCNIGHILSGVPQLSIGSILAGIAIILGAWLAAYVMFVRPMAAE